MKALLIIALLGTALCCDAGTVVQCAIEQLDKPYQWGKEGPDSFDCSGLVRFCYLRAGIDLPHHAASQAGYGTTVSDYQPGDLLFFSKGNTIDSINHVAIYVGNNQYIEAPSKNLNVRYKDMGRTVFLAKRIC